MSDKIDTFEFIRGQYDCKTGVDHKQNQSESYDRGYAAQHQKEQNQEYFCRG